MEHAVLVNGSTSAFLHHWTQYVETHSECQDTRDEYSSFEFDPKGKVESLVVYLAKSKEALACISKAAQAGRGRTKAAQASRAATD